MSWYKIDINNGDSDIPNFKCEHYLVLYGLDMQPEIDYLDTDADTGFTWFANDPERLVIACKPIYVPETYKELI